MDDFSNIKLEEYKFLRQEHENNRRFVFERPLVIVVGMLGITAGLQGTSNDLLGLLPLPFLAILWFNLWFTYNRLLSSARIVSYIQLVHDKDGALWLGWESSLRKYREWIHKKNRKQVTDPGTGKSQADSMMFYQPIYYFHVFMGVLTTALLLLQCGIFSRFFIDKIVTTDKYWIIINIVALTIFLIAVTPYKPSKVRYQIERKLAIWIEVFELNEKGTKISKDSQDC